MTHRSVTSSLAPRRAAALAGAVALAAVLGGASGCATGQPADAEDAASPADLGADRGADVSGAFDGGASDATPPQLDAAPADAAADAAPPPSDAAFDTALPQNDAQADVGCSPGHTGPDCQECLPNLYKCDQLCLQTCASCNGMLATCESPKECMVRCTTCGGSCADCPTGYHLCPSGCVLDGADSPTTGCRYTCDAQPCVPPAHATALCTDGVCDFACDLGGHWVRSGAACVCDAAAGWVEDEGTCVCDAAASLKDCAGACVSVTDPATGCAGASCAACTTPPHATATCDAGGLCDFRCDPAGHWVKSGLSCVCDSGYKECTGTCADVTDPATGCAGASCAACTPPAHATATCAAGGACDFVCDAAGHWVKSGSACVCDAGYVEHAGACVPDVPCPGTYSPATSHCYWYVATAATFAAAEADCAAQGAHLASLGDAAENSYVLGLAAASIWIGLQDHATARVSNSSPDDCTDIVWIDPAGGTYSGSTSNLWDDWDPCRGADGQDAVFGIDVAAPGIWVFSLLNSSFDTVLGLYHRVDDHSGYTSCIGSQVACVDDSEETTRSLLVTNLAAGTYVVVVDGYDGSDYGSFALDVRRFQWTDGSANTWNNWHADEPNNSSTSEYCVEMYQASNAGTWNDVACGVQRPYVCERAY